MECLLCEKGAVYTDLDGYACAEHWEAVLKMPIAQKLDLLDNWTVIKHYEYMVEHGWQETARAQEDADRARERIADIITDATHPRLLEVPL